MGAALKVEKLMSLFSQRETAEKTLTRYPFAYNWKYRAEVGSDGEEGYSKTMEAKSSLIIPCISFANENSIPLPSRTTGNFWHL